MESRLFLDAFCFPLFIVLFIFFSIIFCLFPNRPLNLTATLKGKTCLDLDRRIILKRIQFQGAHWVHVTEDKDGW